MTSAMFRHWLIDIDKKMTEEKRKLLLFIDNYTTKNDVPQITSVCEVFTAKHDIKIATDGSGYYVKFQFIIP